eukprot:524462-Prymnesium_polylepis.1
MSPYVPALRRVSSSFSIDLSISAAFSALISRRFSRTSTFLCTRSRVGRAFSRSRRIRTRYWCIFVSRCLFLWMRI